ncbi:hypothetical protein B2G71_23070 [Novosphingobium sp. PC22D]|nr:hypothetical protein B2G71_23070 [Novosphingobium sp. PC22D]
MEITELREIAKSYREASGLIIKLSNLAGGQIDKMISKVPDGWHAGIAQATDLALRTSYAAASTTHPDESEEGTLNRVLAYCSGERWHKLASSLSGAVGGAGGLTTLAADLAATTTLVLRSIQQIAAGYGENIDDEAVRLECIAVFGFGGPLTEDDEVETGLFGVRMALRGKSLETLLRAIVPRLLPNIGSKAISQAVPLLGALAGATINPVFTDYYQKMAHVHFRLRRLERGHDPEQVKACFERVVTQMKAGKR